MTHLISGTPRGLYHTHKIKHLYGIGLATVLALAVAGCSNGRDVKTLEDPQAQASELEAAENGSADPDQDSTDPVAYVDPADLVADPPVPTTSPNEVVTRPVQPAAAPERIPAPTPRKVTDETVDVAEKPVATAEIDEVLETPTKIIERKETVETSERVIDEVAVEEETGRTVEQVRVIEQKETTVETVEVDKVTGTVTESIVKSEPVEKVVETVTVESEAAPQALAGPKDAARVFAGPGQVSPASYSGYGVFAIRSDTPPAEGDRLEMLCDAFVTALPDADAHDTATQMVTVWPVASSGHAEDLNSASGPERCENAVSHYGGVVGQQAISDSERTGWILDNVGPYLLAWSPPTDKGVDGATVLLVDLSGVTDPASARKIMRHWSEDVERNSTLWSQNRWNPEELSRVVNDWRGEFGPRSILLLGSAGG